MMTPLDPMIVEPVTLSNGFVTLEPLSMKHAEDLHAAVDDRVFEFMPMRSAVQTPKEIRRYIEFQLSRSKVLVFAVIDKTTGKAIGSTSYMNIRCDHRGLEIGSTWITASARGTKINPSMKHLMIKHAFEELGAIRVELRTDARNARSRAAILKLGAVFEGTLRNHIIMPDGHFRDTVVYAIVPEQWPSIEQQLLDRIGS
jgi:RimJ/RimL family protein N-acetyltransferase